jgi:hypothetical protein
MKMKSILSICIVLLMGPVFGQQLLFESDGLRIEAKVQLLENSGKKDKYLLQIKTTSTQQDCYYPASMTVHSKTKKKIITNKTMGSVKIQNATGIFNSENIDGDVSSYKTEDGTALMVFSKGKIYTEEHKFKVPAGVEPVITFTELKTIKRLDGFDLLLDGKILDGNWVSDCIQGTIQLNYKDTGVSDFVLFQYANQQSQWNRRSAQVFQKRDASATITYDNASNSLVYYNNDGIRCVMKHE